MCIVVCYVISLSVPSPDVMATKSELVSSPLLSFNCSIQSHSTVDTPTTVMSSWDAPNSDYDRFNTTNVSLVISSKQTAYSRDYICSASVGDTSDSLYVVNSDPPTDMVNITVSKQVRSHAFSNGSAISNVKTPLLLIFFLCPTLV